MNLKTTLGQLRILGILEGISFLLIFFTMFLKYQYDMGTPNKIVGMAHGVLFIAYCVWVFLYAKDSKWSNATIGWSLLASLVPFGTFVADAKIFKKEADI